ncbi:MAG: hypothetical protein FD147_409 [Chloroflexi bacterium]|nr:MAG: hypothetical protein FD147_409 [Chloroflexota bacterium]MBA4376688.1 hypothetical protein [Anaerolinea sp.]
MNIDIATTFKVILVLVGIGFITSVYMALKSISTGKHLEFYRKRQELIEQGWRLMLLAFVLAIGGFIFFRFGEPIAYHYFPPSPTVSRTPTITITPTITLTPSQTFTPTITLTLAQTYTPAIPGIVQKAIKTPVGVDTKAVFSVVQFSTLTKGGVVINTSDTFTLPITQMYGGYSYDKMVTGVQWSAVWFYEGTIICFETTVWNFPPGGYGYTDACNKQLTPDQWKPGEYEVQIFVGQTWKNSGRFTVFGNQQNITPSPSASSPAFLPAVTQTPKPATNP